MHQNPQKVSRIFWSVVFSPNGEYLASGSLEKSKCGGYQAENE